MSKNRLEEASSLIGISKKTTVKWFKIFRMKEQENEENTDTLQIFSRQGIFEVDETHLYTRRDGRGRILKGESYWVIGIIERRTKKIRLMVSNNPSLDVIELFILANISISSTIITDEWRSYIGLSGLGYIHLTINHSRHFVDSNNKLIHTNTIERLWRDLKQKIPKT